MRYTFFLYSNPDDFKDLTPDDWSAMKETYGHYIAALQEAGVFVDTDWLRPAETATTLSLKDGERRIQDGPYAETKETLGGYFVVEVADLDAALDWAARCPAASMGRIEVRASAMGDA